MPAIGFGTFLIGAEDDPKRCASDALEVGYRKIDTAAYYGNESQIGEALAESGLAREDYFVTTKLWTDVKSYDATFAAVDDMCDNLRTDFLDLLLIHWPTPANSEVWRAMERLFEEGVLGAIGVSNFKAHHIDQLMQTATIPPAVNQMELHPYFQQREMVEYCESHGILVEAWSPLLRGEVLKDPVVCKIATELGRTPSQIVLRYLMEQGISIIPKTTNKARMAENINIFDFNLSTPHRKQLKGLDQNVRRFRDPDKHGL